MPNKSIVNKITLGSTALIVCTFVSALVVNYWQVSSRSKVVQEEQLSRQLSLLSQSLEAPLWSLDENTVQLIGDAYLAGADTVSLEILVAHHEKPFYSKAKDLNSAVSYSQTEVSYKNQIIGHVKIGLSGASSSAELSRLLNYSILLATLIVLSLSFVTKLLIKRSLGTPLDRLGSWTDRVASGDYSKPPPIIEINELRALVEKFTNMAGKIKLREAALSKSEQKLSAILNHHFQLTGLMSIDGKLLMANETALKLSGLKEDEVIGRYFWDTLWWVHSPALQEKLKIAIKKAAQGEFIRFEAKHPDTKGVMHYVDFSLTPLILGDNKKVDFLIPEGRDITEIKNKEKAYRESEERFRSIFEAAAAPMAIIAPNNTFMQVNQAACQFFGYDAEEFQSLNTDDIIQPSDLKKNHKQNEELKSGYRNSIEYEQCYIRKDGSKVWGHSTMASVRDHEGNLLHFVVLTQNITEQKLAELELVKHKDHLEALVAEKTQELQSAQDELLQQERLAALGKLTATVSHELRNPLGAVSNGLYNIEVALEMNDRQMASNALRLSERSVYRCVRIIEELLDYGQKDRLEQKPVAIDELINETLDEMKWPEGFELRRELTSNVVVTGDRERLRRVVLNLVINAQQALQESNQTDKMVLVATRKADENVEFIIEDNGPGIPEDLREKIFEPLFSTKNFGVGLGMTVVKEIIQMHKGDVTLQNPGQQGCRFVVWIPLGGS